MSDWLRDYLEKKSFPKVPTLIDEISVFCRCIRFFSFSVGDKHSRFFSPKYNHAASHTTFKSLSKLRGFKDLDFRTLNILIFFLFFSNDELTYVYDKNNCKKRMFYLSFLKRRGYCMIHKWSFTASLFAHKFPLVDCNLCRHFLSYDTCSERSQRLTFKLLMMLRIEVRLGQQGAINFMTRRDI